MSDAKKHTIKVEMTEEEMRKFLVKCMLNNKEPEDVIKKFMWGYAEISPKKISHKMDFAYWLKEEEFIESATEYLKYIDCYKEEAEYFISDVWADELAEEVLTKSEIEKEIKGYYALYAREVEEHESFEEELEALYKYIKKYNDIMRGE